MRTKFAFAFIISYNYIYGGKLANEILYTNLNFLVGLMEKK